MVTKIIDLNNFSTLFTEWQLFLFVKHIFMTPTVLSKILITVIIINIKRKEKANI